MNIIENSEVPINNVGDGNVEKFDPLLKNKVLKRKLPESSNMISNLLKGNIKARDSVKDHKPKKLGDIIKREKKLEKRSETRNS